jgi:hypothetical protein
VNPKSIVSPHYAAFLTELKAHIAAARLHAANLEQPVQELCSKAQSFVGLGEGAEFLQQLVEEIPWGPHLVLLGKIRNGAALPERRGK